MTHRSIAGQSVAPVGLGCMNLSHAYGAPPAEENAARLLLRAFELGVRHFDTAALYGFGRNETLVGRVLKPHRDEIFLASKCGMTGVDGKRVIDGRPETLKRTCDEALQRLQTDRIDLYYLHRWDKAVAIEESIGALADLVRAGKIGAIGLSEISASTFRKAHAIHPIAAVQSEYSIFTRDPERALLAACEELGVAFVAFSPLCRGLLAQGLPTHFAEGDIRRAMPRFAAPNLEANVAIAAAFARLAAAHGLTPAQLALGWLLARSPRVHVIPGTTSLAHLTENCAAVALGEDLIDSIDALRAHSPAHGNRYPEATLREIDQD